MFIKINFLSSTLVQLTLKKFANSINFLAARRKESCGKGRKSFPPSAMKAQPKLFMISSSDSVFGIYTIGGAAFVPLLCRQ